MEGLEVQHATLSVAKNIWDAFTVFWNLFWILVVWLVGGALTLATVALLLAGVYWLLLG